MCDIKNSFMDSLLSTIRSFDKKEVVDVKGKATMLAHIKYVMDVLEGYETILKRDLAVELNGEIVYVADVDKKVVLADGRASTQYDNAKVLDLIGQENFLKAIAVQKGKLEEAVDASMVAKVMADASTTVYGAPSVSVKAMTKAEKAEHK